MERCERWWRLSWTVGSSSNWRQLLTVTLRSVFQAGTGSGRSSGCRVPEGSWKLQDWAVMGLSCRC